MKENERQNGQKVWKQSSAPAGDRCVLSLGALGDGSCLARSQRVKEAIKRGRGKTTCGKTPVRNEERCSAEVATVAVVGGAEWTNGAVMSRDNYTEGFIFSLLARATAKLR